MFCGLNSDKEIQGFPLRVSWPSLAGLALAGPGLALFGFGLVYY